MGVVEEVRAGVHDARPYLLAHDDPPYDHCHALRVRGRRVHVCARCLGIYPGILLGALAGSLLSIPLALTAVLPLPALADWSAVALADHEGDTHRRTATGFLLGVAYGIGLARLRDGDRRTIALGAVYGIVTSGLLWVERQKRE